MHDSYAGRAFHGYVMMFADLRKLLINSGSGVGIATDYGAGRQKVRSSSPGRVKNVYFSKSSRPALGSTQRIQWVPGGGGGG
jgi:hypothetical protein